jgi:hypothetical protein
MATASGDRPVLLGRPTATMRPVHPARRRLALAVLLVVVGSFLPWLYAAGGIAKSGILGPGLWTLYASFLGLAGVLLPYHRVGAVHAAIMAVAALALPVWQVVHVLGLVGWGGWTPGPGLVLVVAGGVVAASCAVRLVREPASA